MNVTETDVIEETILDDEPACEFKHKVTTCSETVTHVITGCRPPVLACTNAAEHKKQRIAERRTVCTCGKPAADCWQVWPI